MFQVGEPWEIPIELSTSKINMLVFLIYQLMKDKFQDETSCLEDHSINATCQTHCSRVIK